MAVLGKNLPPKLRSFRFLVSQVRGAIGLKVQQREEMSDCIRVTVLERAFSVCAHHKNHRSSSPDPRLHNISFYTFELCHGRE